MGLFVEWNFTVFEPPKRPRIRPAFTNSWPSQLIDGHKELTRSLGIVNL